jgi:hypothetical protein
MDTNSLSLSPDADVDTMIRFVESIDSTIVEHRDVVPLALRERWHYAAWSCCVAVEHRRSELTDSHAVSLGRAGRAILNAVMAAGR